MSNNRVLWISGQTHELINIALRIYQDSRQNGQGMCKFGTRKGNRNHFYRGGPQHRIPAAMLALQGKKRTPDLELDLGVSTSDSLQKYKHGVWGCDLVVEHVPRIY